MGSPVNKRSRTFGQSSASGRAQVALLRSLLRDLGLKRRAKDGNVAVLIAAMHEQPPASPKLARFVHGGAVSVSLDTGQEGADRCQRQE